MKSNYLKNSPEANVISSNDVGVKPFVDGDTLNNMRPPISQKIIDFYNEVHSLNKTCKEFNLKRSWLYCNLRKLKIDTSRHKESFRKHSIKYKIDETIFEKIDSPNKAYLLGLLYSDGTMYKNRKQVRLKLTDVDLLETVNKFLNYDKPLLYYKRAQPQHKDFAQIIICNEKIYDDLINLGCIRNKSYNKTFPEFMKTNPFLFDFIRGYFDGNGSIYLFEKSNKRQGEVKIVSTLNFATELFNIFKNLNIVCYVDRDKRTDERIGQFRIRKASEIIKFSNLIYKDLLTKIFLDRKFIKFKELKTYYDHL